MKKVRNSLTWFSHIPLNSYMMYVVVGCEEVRDLHAGGLVRILLTAQVPDVMAAP